MPSAIGSEENLTVTICDLQTHMKQKEKEILWVKETARRTHRPRKIRIYFPS
jgi:hypothetical protein